MLIWPLRCCIVVAAVLTSACLAYPTPTSPTDRPDTSTAALQPIRVVTQLAIRIIGPDTWRNDRLFVDVDPFDREGVRVDVTVECDSTDGVFEPRSWRVVTRGGVPVTGVKPGSVLTCRHQAIEASYRLTQFDWRLFPGGPSGPGIPVPPATPPPNAPPVTPPPPPATPPPSGPGS